MKFWTLWAIACSFYIGGLLWLVDEVPAVLDHTIPMPLILMNMGAVFAFECGRAFPE